MNNIYFKIGQPNTGKSHGFKEYSLKADAIFKDQDFKYKIIPVSGGIGNEYKGLQNTDLALSYDPIKTEVRFGEFLQLLIKAILQPSKSHVVFLDDFHNQDISSLLSEYTPLFKGQQKANLIEYEDFIKEQAMDLGLIKIEEFEIAEEFILKWNRFIDRLVERTKEKLTLVAIPITNRISGSDLKLIFPANFYLVGAANFNEKTLNIFADWADRAEIENIDPIEVQNKSFQEKEDGKIFKIGEEQALSEDEAQFIKCCKAMNTNLKEILHDENIFDYEKYCFGIWKVVDEKEKIISGKDEEEVIKNRVKVIKFFFSMIKNSLIYNNRNSHINTIGWTLVLKMKEEPWFKANVLTELDFEDMAKYEATDIESGEKATKIFKLLHSLNIYDN